MSTRTGKASNKQREAAKAEVARTAGLRSRTDSSISPAVWLGLIVILIAGTALRLAFLVESHLHVDEYSSIWAALHILQKGVPVLPSGFAYLQGLLFSYVDAAFIGILGLAEWTARLPSMIASVVTLAVVFTWGRRAFSPWAGLLAATFVALDAESIIWGGRARMYALQQMLLVLAFYSFYRGYLDEQPGQNRNRWCWVFAFAFLGATVSQTVSILTVPAILASLFIWRNRWIQRRSLWPPLLVFGLSVPLAFLLNQAGGPVSSTVGRVFIDPAIPWRPKPAFFFREFFWSWPVVLHTGAFVAGFVLLAIDGLRNKQARATSAWVYPYVLVCLTMLPMIFLVGESWQRPRYLAMIQPVTAVLTAGILSYVWMLAGRCQKARYHSVLAVLVWLGVVIVFLPPAIRTIGPSEPAYDQAFHHVQDNWQERDAVIGPLPSIPGTYLGQCDGYALQNGFEEYLITENGRQVDRWTGAPLIDSIAAFEKQFGDGRRVWFVIDDVRWQQRYTPEFREYVVTHMPMVYQTSGVTVYQRRENNAAE